MDTAEAPIYYVLIACGIIILLFTMVFASSSIWVQRKLWRKIRMRMEATMNRMEKERARIAADLHDEATPMIYSVRRKIEDSIGADSKSQQMLYEGREQLVLLEEQLQSISRSMVSLSLQRKGLIYSLQELVLEKRMLDHLDIEYCCGEIPVLTKNAETHIYRIVQEIIHNTIKHAAATRLIISFDYDEPILGIRTSDNGQGFDTEAGVLSEQGLGIANIINRAMFLNGTAKVQAVNGCQWEILLRVG